MQSDLLTERRNQTFILAENAAWFDTNGYCSSASLTEYAGESSDFINVN